jgi:hypothetical protein
MDGKRRQDAEIFMGQEQEKWAGGVLVQRYESEWLRMFQIVNWRYIAVTLIL